MNARRCCSESILIVFTRHHSSLLTEPDIKTFVKVNGNGKLLPVFEKSRAGDDKITGFIPAAENVEFSVGWYTGKRKKAKSSTLIRVYFGETLCVLCCSV